MRPIFLIINIFTIYFTTNLYNREINKIKVYKLI